MSGAHRFDLLSLRLFIATAEMGAIARAADAHHIAPSALSKRIAYLEQTVGAALFFRRHRGIELTPAGEALARHARSVLRLLERMDGELSEFSSGIRGVIRLSGNPSSVIQFLPEDLGAFSGMHPSVQIKLREDMSVAILQAVRDGLADIGIYSGNIPAEDLETAPYRCDTLVVITPLDHTLTRASRVSFAETLAYDHVGLQESSALQALLRAKAAEIERTIRIRVEVMSFEGVRRMVEAGLGIAILPHGVVTPYRSEGGFAAIELAEPWSQRWLNLAVREYRALPIVARELVSHLLGGDDTAFQGTVRKRWTLTDAR
jgi:DNA-binding transcriptional LysR family regulator